MSAQSATAVACANIAIVKYWGNRDDALRLPANGSISMNLEGLFTRTRVTWDELRVTSGEQREADSLVINGRRMAGDGLRRVSAFLDLVRKMAGIDARAIVESENNFPAGVGIASSASAFAALTLAASVAAGLDLEPAALSRLARRGSGSACSRDRPSQYRERRSAYRSIDAPA